MTTERIHTVNKSLAYMTTLGYEVKVSDGLVAIKDAEGREWTKYPAETADELCRNILNEAAHRTRVKAFRGKR